MRLLYGVKSSEKYLYHYTPARTAIDYIAPSWTLKIGKISETNDPRETKNWSFNLWTSGVHDLGRYKMSELSSALSDALKERTKALCFSRDHEGLTGSHVDDILKRGLAKSRMWAQYAGNHTGFCLIVDRHALLEAVKRHVKRSFCWAAPVDYRNRDLVPGLGPHEFAINVDELERLGFGQYALNHLQKFHGELFFEKLLDWRDEVEWRLIVVGGSPAPVYLPLDDAVVGFVHGAATSTEDSDRLMQITEGRNVEHIGLRWENSGPWYDLGNLKWSDTGKNSPWRAERGVA